ncbi:FKBP-type peptidyl-prolyl cis-trans isomerase [Nocardioides donggukensis]|uniref:peptidylprolyl isomerase n=1 Tax=Nocardioides donggukensis TaxID=2774019 RepID=A0A927K5S2_9ACTN|nr:FKBP-type peptidyl-prolyl cis-trans isomerase [Nocardioides donggukensis]MBD8869528.1 FKBP-type peptidyl-prolyl cis-trans isomerase [Nocardioides donggukensis]
MRRVPALPGSSAVLPAVLLALGLGGLTACGTDDGSGSIDGGAAAAGTVTVSGDFGKAPKVKYDGRLGQETSETTVLTEGEGADVEDGESAMVHLYIGNGFSGEKAYSTYDDNRPTVLEVGENSLPALREAVVGHPAGSRVQVLAAPEDAYGEAGNPNLFIGNGDSVVFVVDILSTVLDGPEGAEQEAPAGLPSITETDGTVTALDFADAEPAGKGLQVVTLVEGEGPEIEKGSFLAMHYLGQVEGKKKPFDENYSAEAITPFRIGKGDLIKGWDEGLVGVPVGSRVMLVVPPRFGYGAKGNDGAGIKGTDTIYFVIDVLGVS